MGTIIFISVVNTVYSIESLIFNVLFWIISSVKLGLLLILCLKSNFVKSELPMYRRKHIVLSKTLLTLLYLSRKIDSKQMKVLMWTHIMFIFTYKTNKYCKRRSGMKELSCFRLETTTKTS